MVKEKSLMEKVEWIRSAEQLTDYQIAKDTGIAYSAVYRFRHSQSKIENITLGAALKYAILYDALNKK